MSKVKLLEEALSMLQITEGEWTTQNLRGQVPTIIEYIIDESHGKTNVNWVEESIRLLRPRCREDSIEHGEEILRTYNQIMHVYDHVVKNARQETYNMKKFRDTIGFYARYLNMLGRVPCNKENVGA